MVFKSALTKVCHDFSKDIIFERRIISILDDYMAFKDVAYYKLFYNTILNIADMAQLISQNPNERAKAIYTFLAVSGLDESKVKAFLSLISECYHGESLFSIQSNNYTTTNVDTTLYPEVKHRNCVRKGPELTDIPHSAKSHIKFLGKELGCSICEMSDYLLYKGFKHTGFSYDGTRPEYSGSFLGFPDSVIIIWKTAKSQIVWRIEIRLKIDINTIKAIYSKKYTIEKLDFSESNFLCKLHSGTIYVRKYSDISTTIEYEDNESFNIRQLEKNEASLLKEKLAQQEINQIINLVKLEDI